MTEVVNVEVKSAWLSKINWTQIIAAVSTLVTTNALGLDDATQVKVLAVTSIIHSVATVVLKTWFTPTVTPASVTPPTPGKE